MHQPSQVARRSRARIHALWPILYYTIVDRIAEMIAQSNAALVATLAESLHGLKSPHIPSLQLSRFMRVLTQLRNQMERAAASDAEDAALVLIRDNAPKGLFLRGVREQSVCQELRRIAY